MVFDAHMDKIIVIGVEFVEIPSSHQRVGAGKGQPRQTLPFRVARNSQPVPFPLRGKIVHFLNATGHHNIRLTAFDRHPRIPESKTRRRAGVFNTPDRNAIHAGMFGQQRSGVAQLSASKRNGSNESFIDGRWFKVAVYARERL